MTPNLSVNRTARLHVPLRASRSGGRLPHASPKKAQECEAVYG